MGKVKIYEIAKELNMDNKDLIGIAKELGIEAKSHLSSIDEADAKKIKQKLNKKQTNKKENKDAVKNEKVQNDNAKETKKDSKKESKNQDQKKIKKEDKKDIKKEKEEIKTTGQVIIRREVIVEEEKKPTPIKEEQKSGIGFNTQRRNKDFNIVYREKPSKPMTVNELFGLKPKNVKEEKKEVPKVEKIEKAEVKPEESKKVSKPVEVKAHEEKEEIINKAESTRKPMYNKESEFGRNNRQERFNRNQDTNSEERYNRPRNNENSYNRNSNNFHNRNQRGNFSQNGENRSFNNRPSFNRNNNQNANGFKKDYKRPAGNRQNDRSYNNDMLPIEMFGKNSKKDYSLKIIDKQKANRNLEEKKKTRTRRGMEESFDGDKLRDLKQVNRLSNMFEDQEGGMLDYYDLTTARGKRNRKKDRKDEDRKQKIFELKDITIPTNISVKDLAIELKKTSAEVIKKLFDLGIMANINQDLDFDTAYLVADSFGVTATKKEEIKDEDILFDDSEDKEEDLEPRPPVVVVMGHVDHGKTSLLDAIRKTNVIEGEAGGITQHIGAYKVNVNNREITFLDTPGHEAFTSMRARGAQITDVAILVVAADDGVMPQTIEAINHAKAANTPIIVAVNKIDLPAANVDKVKQELMKYELVPEEWGGDTVFVPISAKNNINIDNLLEMVLLVADMQNLKANPNRQSKGTVIEARLDKTQGAIASVLVQRGTLNVGDTIILGTAIGKIRTMKNDKGKLVKTAGPSTPVEITGLHEVPEAGDIFYEVKNEKVAKHLIEQRRLANREKAIANNDAVTLDNLFDKMESEDLKQLSIIVKTDVQGTAEALKGSLEKLSNEEVKVKVIHSNAGGVTESDVQLAKAANAIIIAFNVRTVGAAKALAEKENVEIKQYSVIYQAIDDVEDAMKGMLAPVYKETNIGNAEVRQIFKITNVGTIAGCYVTDGKLERNAGVRVIREGIVIHEGKLVSLKRFKDDAKEVSKGFECGLQIEDYNDLKEGDTIEAYIQEEVKR